MLHDITFTLSGDPIATLPLSGTSPMLAYAVSIVVLAFIAHIAANRYI